MSKCRDKIIPSHHVDSANIRCPDCKGNSLVLEGFVQRSYAVELTNGQVTDEQLPEESWIHDVRMIHCLNPACKVVYNIVSQDLWEAINKASAGAIQC